MDIPRHPRYGYVTHLAQEFLLENNINTFPINPFQLAEYMDIQIEPYSKIAKKNEVKVRDIIKSFGSSDGVSGICDGIYYIFYNDKRDSRRVVFTLLHEIGHIYLNHFIEFEQTELRRNGLKAKEYEVLEREVNCFARNVLAPAAVINNMTERDPSIVSNIFNISYSAAVTRLNFLKADLSKLTYKTFKKMENWFQNYIYKVTHLYHCPNCQVDFYGENPCRCKICGEYNLIRSIDFIGAEQQMIYKSFMFNEYGTPQFCPICDNEELDDGVENCKICNTIVVNRCISTYQEDDSTGFDYLQQGCETLLDGNARYCRCGNESTYYRQCILKDWQAEKEEYERQQNSGDLDLFNHSNLRF